MDVDHLRRERERERDRELTENRWSSEHPDTRDNVQQKKKKEQIPDEELLVWRELGRESSAKQKKRKEEGRQREAYYQRLQAV